MTNFTFEQRQNYKQLEWETFRIHFIHVSECLHVSRNNILQFFLITTQTKQNKFGTCFVDIAKEATCEQIQINETLLELVLLEVYVSLKKRPDFWKSLSKIIYIIFHCRTSVITQQEHLCLGQKNTFFYLYGPFLWIVPSTHYIDLGRMKGWDDIRATQRFWKRDPWIRNPAP